MDVNTNKQQIIAVVILSTGSHHKITQETYEQICGAGLDDLIRTHTGATFKTSAVMEILSIEDYEAQYPDKNLKGYGQPYADIKALPTGNVYERSTKNGKELMLKGFKKVKPKATEADLRKFSKPTSYKPLYDHVFDEKGNIIKPAWEVRAEALGEKPKVPKVQEEDLLPVI